MAIVWKWGSGKSTISSLIISYMNHHNKNFWAIDADTNMHLWLNFDIDYDNDKALSDWHNEFRIREYLMWNNIHIISPSHMIKTTPPGPWSVIIKSTDDWLLKKYSIWQIWSWELFFVWWYTGDWAWTSCYHTNLAILENLLAHTNFEDEYLIVDMVASTDTFAGPMYTQFDKIILIVEPTKESVDLAKKYMNLAKSVNTNHIIQYFWNKIVDEEDIEFIKKKLLIDQIPYLKIDNDLKKHLRNWMSMLTYFEAKKSYLSDVFSFLNNIQKIPFKTKTQLLAELHRKVSQLDYIKMPLWDLTHQIDEDFINSL